MKRKPLRNQAETTTPPVAGLSSAERAQRAQYELMNEGARLLAQYRPGEAAAVLEKAYALDPANAVVAINLGGAYVMQRRFALAIPLLEKACQSEPDNAMAWTNLAAAYLGRLELSSASMQDRAIAAFEHALLADPQAPNVNYNLGLIYKERGDRLRAIAHFWRALDVNPDDRDARAWLDRLQQAGQTAEEGQDAANQEPDGGAPRSSSMENPDNDGRSA